MKLRELINKLEELSCNGRNDNLEVEVFNSNAECNTVNGNDICDPIKHVWVDAYVSPDTEYNYIQIEI